MDEIYIFGTGGHSNSVANVALSCGFKIAGYIKEANEISTKLSFPVINEDYFFKNFKHCNVCVAVGDNHLRKLITEKILNQIPKPLFPKLIHSSCVIGNDAKIGNGSILMPFVNIGPNTCIGENCIINSSSSIDHDCSVDDFSSIAPGVIIGGNVLIGRSTHIGISASLKNNIRIGSNVVIGAKSYANKNIPDNTIAYGSPCKEIRSRNNYDKYL